MTLPALFPAQDGLARNAAILASIVAGQASWSWSPITSTANGHTATFAVLTDGLKLGGVRLSGSAGLCQTVADLLGALLQTPRLNDLAWLQADVQIPPATMWPNGTDTASMVKESALIDAAVAGRSGLVAPTGKPWALGKAMTVSRSLLYGWQSAKPIPGVPLYASPATPGVKVIQPLSNAHEVSYGDYSSLVNLVARPCLVDGVPHDLVDVLSDPELAPLASHEGVIPTRQPGVPVTPALPTSGASGGPVFSLWTPPSPEGASPLPVASASSNGGALFALGMAFAAAGFAGGLYFARG